MFSCVTMNFKGEFFLIFFCKLLFQTEILSESKVERIRIQRARNVCVCVCDFNWTVSWSCKQRIQNMKSAAVVLFVGTGL